MVNFYTSDSLLISADHYYSDPEDPYILLFHTEESSRGEYAGLAERFVKMHYNCLAVDLRKGDKYGYIDNLSATRAKNLQIDKKKYTANDILAAIDYAFRQSNKKVILLGSSWSASHALKIGSSSPMVQAIIAFSPGEAFVSGIRLADILKQTDLPVYIASSPEEMAFMDSTIRNNSNANVTLFDPPEKTLNRGIQLLFDNNPSHNEYWLSLLIFIKSLKN